MHPEYVNRNRELQRNRNEKRKKIKQKDIEGMIVNTDTLFTHPLIDGTYALMQVTKGGKIVNTDSIAQGILTIYFYQDQKLAR